MSALYRRALNRAVINFQFAVFFLFAVLPLCGCERKPIASIEGVLVDAIIPKASHKRVSAAMGLQVDGLETFPQIRVYDSSGRLVRVAEDSSQSRLILDQLVARTEPATPIKGAPSLEALIKAVPEFHEWLQGLKPSAGPTVVSVLLDECKGCVAQESAFVVDEPKLRKAGVDTLVMHFSRN